MVRLTDPPDMTLDVYRGHKTTQQQQMGDQKTVTFRDNGSANRADHIRKLGYNYK